MFSINRLFKPFFFPSFLQVLILHLKRLNFPDKISEFVDFPLRGLDVGKYLNNNDNNNDNDKNSVYDLNAVINHNGGNLGGHFLAYARLPEESDSAKSELPWRLFDDSKVTTVKREADVITPDAYVMFFVRRDEEDVAGSLAAAATAAMATGNGDGGNGGNGGNGDSEVKAGEEAGPRNFKLKRKRCDCGSVVAATNYGRHKRLVCSQRTMGQNRKKNTD